MSPRNGRTLAFLLVTGTSRLAWALPPVREKSADRAMPNRSESDEKARPEAQMRKLVRTWPAGTLNAGPEAMNWALPASDFEWPVSWARRASGLAGTGPAALTT